MFFLTNMYERRFNENMQRHRLDAKIAPSRPKPACRPVQNETVREQKNERVNCFLVAQQKESAVAINQVSPTSPFTYHNSSFGVKTQLTGDNQLSLFEIKAPMPMDQNIKLKRSGSQESGFYTGGDSDTASNISIQA